ncbi:hypothetical protein [Phytohabitans rumicis]|uniref:DUF4386 family protein n=1 Tax=Phytohabitans rumicis TaxID=1076125 RepID=A0A6V8LFH8_9ACTN|nr:hypothetical protein [Phytohabitans rumicis]GFJ93591.1 hypothetical protein Prum_072330 [Phytohabitans rumicis]
MSESAQQEGRSRRRAAYLTAGLGLLHAVLVLSSLGILRRAPGINASDAELIAFYGGGERQSVLVAGLYLMPFAAISFVWFIVALRTWVASYGRPEHSLFSNVQLIAGIIFVALFLIGGAAFSIDAAGIQLANATPDPSSMRLFPQLGQVTVVVLAMRMAAIFVLTTSSIGRHTHVLPTWFNWLGYPVGLFLLLAASLNTLLVTVFPVWVTVLSIVLIVRARRIPRQATLPPGTVWPLPNGG